MCVGHRKVMIIGGKLNDSLLSDHTDDAPFCLLAVKVLLLY